MQSGGKPLFLTSSDSDSFIPSALEKNKSGRGARELGRFRRLVVRQGFTGYESPSAGFAARCEAGLRPAVGALLEIGAVPPVRPLARRLGA